MNAPASLRPLNPTPGPDPVPVTDEELAQLAPEPVELDILAPENLDAYLAKLEADEADPNKPGAVSAFLSGAANAAVELVDSFKTAGVLTGQNAMAAAGGALALDGQQFKDAARRQTALGVQAGAMFAATYPMIGETVKGAFKEVGTKLGQGYQDTPENRRKVAAVRQARDRALRDINNLTDSALVIADHVVGGLDLRNAYSETETQDMMKAAGGMAEVGDLAFGLGVAKGAKLGQKLAAAGARAAEKAATTAGADKVADLIQSTTKYAGSLQDRFYRAAAAAADSKVPNFGALTDAARKVAQLQDERLVLEAAADSAERTAALTQNAARISEQKAVIEKIQADFTRRADEAALAANTRPVSQTIAGGAIQLGGDAMTAVGRKGQAAVDWLRDKRSSALGTSDEAVRLGDEVVERATGVSPGLVERTAGWVADLGENVSAAGRLMRTAESSTPYFQRLAKETDGWTRFAAQNANRVEFISRLGRGAAEATDGAFRGGAQGAMFGLLQGDPTEGAGEGFLGGFFGGSLRTIRLETDPGAVRARQIGDIAEARSRRAGLQQRLFDEAPRNVQLAAATFEATNPNLIVDFVRQKGSGGSYVVNPDGTGTATIDLDSRIALAPLLAHEVTHHIARNPDISADLRRRFLGDETAGKPGYFTELKDGKLQPKADFAAFRDEYLAKLRDAGKDTAAYEANPELILHEVIAEAGVASLLATNNAGEFAGIGALRRKARPLVPLVERFARSEMVMNSSVLQRALMATGAVFREDGRFADGTGLFETDMSPELRSAVKQVIREYDLMNLSERTGQVESFSETPTIYSEQELVSNPELMDLVSSGFDVDIDPATGKRKFLTAREAKQREQEFIDDLILALDASPDISPGRVRAVTTKDGRTIYSGKYIPADVLESLQSKNKYNPRQLEMLAMLTDTLAKRPGTEAHFVYQPAMTRGSRLYKQRAVTNRVETPISILISRTGGVLVNTISQEKVLRNLDFFARKGLLGSWGGDVRAARADLLKYIDNTVAGREGAEGLGLEKRDALNALFGQLAQVQKDRNPVLQGMSDAQGRKLGVVQSRRLDRINQMRILDSEFRANYDRVSQNLRPEEGAMGPEDSQLEGFQASMRESMAERIRNNPKSDYSAGDTLYTPKGTPVKFITDLLAVRKGKDDGAQRAYVQFPDGHQSSVLLRDLSPEPPAGQEPQFPRDIGSNVEFAVPPSDEEAKAALSADRQPKFGLARDLEAGTPVGLRIDIPAFQRTGKYVVSVHEKAKGNTVGRIVGYDTVVTVDNPTFMSNEAGASKILTGEKNKFPIATVEGSFNSSREIPADINEWTAVGFDPLDHSYFYDKRTDEPVIGGKQAVSVGNSVFVKNPVYGNRSDFQYRPDSRQTETPEFKNWFGESKVVDEQGKPLVVYHGASSDFTEFRGRNGWNYLSDSRKFAEKFETGGGLKELFASIENPLDLTEVPARKVGINKLVSVLNEAGIDMTSADFPFYGRDLYQILNTDSVQKTLRSKAMAAGYDGIKFPDFYDPKNRGTSYVAFDSTQIKSATGNRGTFDPTNPDIQYRPDAEQHVENIRAIDATGNKDATQVDPASLKYPANPVPDSVALPARWGMVNRNIVGMPRSYAEVDGIITRAVDRLKRVAADHPEFAKESARFYQDMAESSVSLADVVSAGVDGWEKANLSDLMLRYLALGSPRTNVTGNATKSSGSAAGLVSDFEPGFKIGFGNQQLGAKATYGAWSKGEHFNLDAAGIDDKVRSFYINGLSELIEMLQIGSDVDRVSADRLLERAGRSLHVLKEGETITDAHRTEIQRLLDGKATIDMWDMAGKGFAWPGFILRRSERNRAEQPFQWTQDDFAKKSTISDNAWKTVLRDLSGKKRTVKSPADLRYQEARSLRIDGNKDWNEKTWADRKTGEFKPETEFTYYTQGTEAGLTPGGAGPMYDAQQAMDGLIADRLNELGMASMFGKTKLKARNAQEILWALEKLDNPIKANNDLSLYGKSITSLLNEVQGLRDGKTLTKKSRAEAILNAMDRAYEQMARQELPIEAVTSGTSDNALAIRNKIAAMKNAGDASAEVTITTHIADGLGDAINDLATKHDVDVTVDEVHIGRGGYTENGRASVSPNMRLILRGPRDQVSIVLDAMSRAMDQDGGNIVRKPTVRELNDSNTKKNIFVTFDTSPLTASQREEFFLELNSLKDADGNAFLTGFTETKDGGMAIGDQFYGGRMLDALRANETAISAIMGRFGVMRMRRELMMVEMFFRGTPETPASATLFAQDIVRHIQGRVSNAQASTAADMPQSVEMTGLLSRRSQVGLGRVETATKSAKTKVITKLKSDVDAALLRGQISPDTAERLKKAISPEAEVENEDEDAT